MDVAEHLFEMFFVSEMKNKDVEGFKKTYPTLYRRVVIPTCNGVASRQRQEISPLLKEAMEALDDYLNAGCKEARKAAAEKSKKIYLKYYGVEFKNRNER